MPVRYWAISPEEVNTLNTEIDNLKSVLKQKNLHISDLEAQKTQEPPTEENNPWMAQVNNLKSLWNQKDVAISNNSALENKLEALTNSIEKITALDTEINKLKSVIKKKNLRISELEAKQMSLNDISKIHKSYNDNEIKDYLSAKLNFSDQNNIVRTYVYFGQKMNLDALWLCVREKAIKDKESNIFLKLRDFLYLVMKEFFITHPKYAFIDEKIIGAQSSLDYEVHKTSKAKIGRLSNIILHGYYSKVTNNILKKSIVTLE